MVYRMAFHHRVSPAQLREGDTRYHPLALLYRGVRE